MTPYQGDFDLAYPCHHAAHVPFMLPTLRSLELSSGRKRVQPSGTLAITHHRRPVRVSVLGSNCTCPGAYNLCHAAAATQRTRGSQLLKKDLGDSICRHRSSAARTTESGLVSWRQPRVRSHIKVLLMFAIGQADITQPCQYSHVFIRSKPSVLCILLRAPSTPMTLSNAR
jgi:hypothetical protein